MFRQLSICFFVFFSAASGWSRDYIIDQYYNVRAGDGKVDASEVLDYDNIAPRLKPGDTIFFDNEMNFSGKNKFEILGLLGKGNSSAVYDIGDDRALRIPLSIAVVWRGPIYLRGARELENSKIQMVKVYHSESSSDGQFVVVEKKNFVIDLFKFLHSLREGIDVPENINKEKAFAALMRFSESTYEFKFIPDFGWRQILFDGTNWVLVDWMAGAELISGIYDTVPFEELGVGRLVPRDMVTAAKEKIIDIRRKSCPELLSKVGG